MRRSTKNPSRFYFHLQVECAKRGMTISDLCKGTGISQNTMAYYRNNQPLAITNFYKTLDWLSATPVVLKNPEADDNA